MQKLLLRVLILSVMVNILKLNEPKNDIDFDTNGAPLILEYRSYLSYNNNLGVAVQLRSLLD